MSTQVQDKFRAWTGTRDEKEARGEVWIERGSYGFDIYVKGACLDETGRELPVCTIDLFPQSPRGQEIEKFRGVVAQLLVNPYEEYSNMNRDSADALLTRENISISLQRTRVYPPVAIVRVPKESTR